MKPAMNVQPGDLLVTRSDSLPGKLIRFGAALAGRPNLDNHVAIVHHTDRHGTTWCLEGRPGGVGWRDARDYLASRWTLNNCGQPKTAVQRTAICKLAVAMIGTSYDWSAIAEDALSAFGIPLHEAWQLTDGHIPGHVVCSSLAAYLYGKAGLDCPPAMRLVTPGDWDALIIQSGWSVKL